MSTVVLEPGARAFADRARPAEGVNVVPVSCELLADLETPISAYLRLRDLPASFLLESVEGGAQVARFSVLGGNPRLVLDSDGTTARMTDARGTRAEAGHPLEVARALVGRYRAAPDPALPPFVGGFLGYFGYDTVRLWERLPDRPPDDLGLPVFRLALMDTVVVFDHRRHTLRVVANAFLDEGDADQAYRDAARRIDVMLERLSGPRPPPPPGGRVPLDPRPNVTPETYLAAVERAQEYIRAGDVFQVVLSRRVRRRSPGSIPWPSTAAAGRQPVALHVLHGARQRRGDHGGLVAGAAGAAGGRPGRDAPHRRHPPARGDAAEDAALEAELQADEKERAEHVMLVDLGRNDVGRVAAPGSVRVTS